jgi:N-acetylglutamate synthase-like GNAT family acetyltransferase
MDKLVVRPRSSRRVKNINIRDFKARDAETCFKIRSAAFIQKFYNELGARATSAGVNAFMPIDYVQMAQKIPFFVAEDASGIIGFFTIQRKVTLVAEIPLIYIDLNQLGKQIGQTFMEYIEQWVTTNWPEVTTLIVDTVIPEYNSGFYQKVGFKPVGDSICDFPDMQVPAMRLEKKLKA